MWEFVCTGEQTMEAEVEGTSNAGLRLGLWPCEFAGRFQPCQGVCRRALQRGIRGSLWSHSEGVCVCGGGVFSSHFLPTRQGREEGDQRLTTSPTMYVPGRSVLQGVLNLEEEYSVCVVGHWVVAVVGI